MGKHSNREVEGLGFLKVWGHVVELQSMEYEGCGFQPQTLGCRRSKVETMGP